MNTKEWLVTESWSNAFSKAVALHQMGNLSEAEILYKNLCMADPHNADVLALLGIVYVQRGNVPEGLEALNQAIAINPCHAEAYNNRASVFNQLERYVEAVADYDKAVTINDSYTEAFHNRGLSLNKLKRYGEALASYDKAIALDPHYAQAYSSRGSVLHKLKRDEEALASYDKAIALNPLHAETYSNRGVLLQHMQRFDEALACYNKALSIKPNYAEAYHNIGNLMHELQRYDEALEHYSKALAINPDYVQPRFGIALAMLALGEYTEGWKLYEWRWKLKEFSEGLKVLSKPQWLGTEDITGKTVLLHAEQGHGDILQFCRYAPMVEESGAQVLLAVPSSLRELMSTLRGTLHIIDQSQPLPEYDFHCPLLSLPMAFGTTVETIPSEPYLYPPTEYVEKWKSILEKKLDTQELRIGLCWAGGQRPDDPDCVRTDGRRSLHFSQLKPLLEVPHTGFVSLQLGPPKDQLDDTRVADISGGLQNWSDTAAVVSMLDLVITVDTSVCHLAGAMGKKTWLLNRYDTCWRWLLDRDDSPWYPSLTQFRQTTPGNWDEVIARVKRELEMVPLA